MARLTNRLSARGVIAMKEPGRHADGGGLYLQVDASGAKRWVLVFQWRGARKEMGLGSTQLVDLVKAREAALAARQQVKDGINPIEARRSARADASEVTFGQAADDLLASMEAGWKSAKHKAQWKHSLEVRAAAIRPLPVAQVGTEDVLGVLTPIWTEIPETASRTRGRIERTLDAAKAKGQRTGENPARWRGHLQLLLPKRRKLYVGHHPALPFKDAPAFMVDLRGRQAPAADALELTILAATRTSETLGARRREFDRAARVWTIPGERMKGTSAPDHQVPITAAMEALLERLWPATSPPDPDAFLFPGQKPGQPLSSMAMQMLLRRMKRTTISVHGFRSTFSDWAGETTGFARDDVERCLAHQVGNEVEQAYRRGNALEKRRRIMAAWASYLAKAQSDNIIRLQA